MTAGRLRAALLGATAALGGLVLLAWSQPWFTIAFTPESGESAPLEVRGDVAAGALAPLGLTVLAVVAALALAGVGFRMVLGVLEALVGAAIVAVAIVALADPVTASSHAITETTGVAGRDSVAGLVAGVASSAWPVVAIVLGAAVIVVGVLVTATAARWPRSGRRYTRTRLDPEAPDGGHSATDPVAEWDALSDGADPTAPGR